MSIYQDYAKRENLFIDEKEDKLPLSAEDLTIEKIKEIDEHINACLSPEMLYKDGEATKEEVEATLRFFKGLCNEIKEHHDFVFYMENQSY